MSNVAAGLDYIPAHGRSQRGPAGGLPLLSAGPVQERADAARNRAKALAAAERLFAARGVAAVSMDDIAASAGVGKGTLYRRFGDKSGLAAALLDERESRLQAAMLGGPPPLGPGAPPADRLAAFTAAYLEFVDANLDLVAMSQTASPGRGCAPAPTGSGASTAGSCSPRPGRPIPGLRCRRTARRAHRRAGPALAARRRPLTGGADQRDH